MEEGRREKGRWINGAAAGRQLMVLLLFIVSCMVLEEAEGLTEAECREQRRMLVSVCKPVVFREPPSSCCCKRLRVTPIDCICSVITPKIAPLIDVGYAVQVVQSCGRQVPRHFKCGSITTP